MTQTPNPEQLDGLIDSLSGLSSEIRKLRQDVKAERARRGKQIAALMFAVIIVVIVGTLGFLDSRAKTDDIIATRTNARAADCSSLGDVGSAIKQGITAVSLPADATPEQKQRLDEFIAAYNAKVDSAIEQARAKKGYSADCKVIGNPPPNQGN